MGTGGDCRELQDIHIATTLFQQVLCPALPDFISQKYGFKMLTTD